MLMGVPARWFDRPTFRCTNGHVRADVHRAPPATSADLFELFELSCLECGADIDMTYPEDHE